MLPSWSESSKLKKVLVTRAALEPFSLHREQAVSASNYTNITPTGTSSEPSFCPVGIHSSVNFDSGTIKDFICTLLYDMNILKVIFWAKLEIRLLSNLRGNLNGKLETHHENIAKFDAWQWCDCGVSTTFENRSRQSQSRIVLGNDHKIRNSGTIKFTIGVGRIPTSSQYYYGTHWCQWDNR